MHSEVCCSASAQLGIWLSQTLSPLTGMADRMQKFVLEGVLSAAEIAGLLKALIPSFSTKAAAVIGQPVLLAAARGEHTRAASAERLRSTH